MLSTSCTVHRIPGTAFFKEGGSGYSERLERGGVKISLDERGVGDTERSREKDRSNKVRGQLSASAETYLNLLLRDILRLERVSA